MTLDYREKCLSQKINTCYACGSSDEKLVVHHVNGDRQDHSLDNLVPMCRSCHSRLHTADNLSGVLARLRDKLPPETIPSLETESENATARLPITPSTKDLLDEEKGPGKTYDRWVREQLDAVD